MAPATKGATKPKAGAPVTPGSKKRKSEAPELTLEEEIAAYKQDLNGVYSPEYYVDLHLPSPGTLRGRVNKLFDSGIMTKSEFGRAVGTKTNTLNRFLTQSRTANVSGSSVYAKAWIWFQQREEAGLKMPDVRKRQKKEADAAAAAAAHVYFEKLRLARGQPESEHRQTMEDIYIDGIDRNVHSGTRSRGVYFDEFGRPSLGFY